MMSQKPTKDSEREIFSMTPKKEAISYIVTEGKGYRDDLEKKIGKTLLDEFCLLGYITQGATMIDEGCRRTWSATEKAKTYKRLYIDPLTDTEIEKAQYLQKIGVHLIAI